MPIILLLLFFTSLLSLFSSCRSTTVSSSAALNEEGNPGDKTTESTQDSVAKKNKKGEMLNRSRYIVGNQVITELDLQRMKTLLRQQGVRRNIEKKTLDVLIERQLLDIAAEKNSIIISQERIEEEANARRLASGLKPKQFRSRIEKESGLSYDEWVTEIYYELAKQYFMQINLNVAPLSEKEIRRFYRRNRQKLGMEIRYREIVLAPKKSGVKEELRISKLAENIYNRLQKSPTTFAKVARSTKENSSRSRLTGGLHNYRPIHEIAAEDNIVANLLFQEKSKKILRPFRDQQSRYRIIKTEGRRYLPYKKVKPLIQRKLYYDKLQIAFQKWVKKRRQEVSIQKLP